MLIIETLPLLRQHIRRWRQEGKRIALVPTMGNLHDGHMKLVDEASARAQISWWSVSSLTPCSLTAPTIWRATRAPCRKIARSSKNATADIVFSPAPADVYPQGTEEPDLR